MGEKAKGGNATPENSDKGSVFSTTYQVLEILKSGREVTAVGLNRAVHFNDARKAISVLRRKGYPINDRWLPNRCKAYSLPYDWRRIMREAKQLRLFELWLRQN
jgi:hypothetical protein